MNNKQLIENYNIRNMNKELWIAFTDFMKIIM